MTAAIVYSLIIHSVLKKSNQKIGASGSTNESGFVCQWASLELPYRSAHVKYRFKWRAEVEEKHMLFSAWNVGEEPASPAPIRPTNRRTRNRHSNLWLARRLFVDIVKCYYGKHARTSRLAMVVIARHHQCVQAWFVKDQRIEAKGDNCHYKENYKLVVTVLMRDEIWIAFIRPINDGWVEEGSYGAELFRFDEKKRLGSGGRCAARVVGVR